MVPNKIHPKLQKGLEEIKLNCLNCNDSEWYVYNDMLTSHAPSCYQKPVMSCPLMCGAELKDQRTGNEHINVCPMVL